MNIKRHPTAAHTEVSGEVFVVTGDNRLHNLRGNSALAIWTALAGGPTTEDALVELLTDQFEVDSSTARTDVRQFVERGRALGVLASE